MKNSIFSLSVIAGIVFSALVSVVSESAFFFVYSSFLVLVVLLFHRFPQEKKKIGICTLIFFLSFWRGSIAFSSQENTETQSRFSEIGVITTMPSVSAKSQTFSLKVKNQTITMTTNLYPRYQYGDWLSVVCERVEDNYCSFPTIHRIGEGKGSPLLRTLFTFKNWLITRLREVVSEPSASFAAALLLGERSALPETFREALQATGTVHIVAVSGMHVVLLTGVMQYLLLFLPLSARMRRIATAAFLLFFTLMIGAPASAVRGLLFGTVLLASEIVGRPRQVSLLLSVVCAALLLLFPRYLFDVGFLLSFLAVLGIVYGVPVLAHFTHRLIPARPFAQAIMGGVLVTLAATITTTPLIAYTFGRISLSTIVVNTLVVPLVEGATILTLLVVVLAATHPIIAFPFGIILSFLLTLIMGIISFFGVLPGTSIVVSPSSPLLLLSIYSVVFGFLFFFWSRLSLWERTSSLGRISSTP